MRGDFDLAHIVDDAGRDSDRTRNENCGGDEKGAIVVQAERNSDRSADCGKRNRRAADQYGKAGRVSLNEVRHKRSKITHAELIAR